MDEQQPSKKDEKTPASTPPETVPKPLVEKIETPKQEKQTAEQIKESADETCPPHAIVMNKEGIKWTDVAIVILTAGIVYFAWVQSQDTKNAGKQTDNIISADNRIAKAMEDTLAQSGTALQATIAQNELNQRAWVGPFTAIAPALEPKKEIFFGFKITNSGKTPGRNIRVWVQSGSFPKDQPFVPVYKKEAKMRSQGVLQPGMNASSMTDGFIIPDSEWQYLKSGAKIAHIWISIEYDDIFNHHHTATACVFYEPDLKTVNNCSTYNTAD